MAKRKGSKRVPIWIKHIYQTIKGVLGKDTEKRVMTTMIYEYQEEINEKGVRTEIQPLNSIAFKISLKKLNRSENENTINKGSKKGRKDPRGVIWSKWFGKDKTNSDIEGQNINS